MSESANRIFRIAAVLIICACVWSSPLPAYVLQGPFILESMTEQMGRAKQLSVFQTLHLYDQQEESRAFEFQETLHFDFPNQFRSDITSDNVRRIHVKTPVESITIMDDRVVSEPETRLDLYKDIILYNTAPELEKRLTDLGIDVSISSVGKFQDRIAYVVGAQYPDSSVSQVWIDKTTFKPWRWIVRDPGDTSPDNGLEVRYIQWSKTGTIWYPMVIEFYANNRLIRTIEANRIEVNPAFPADLFDIDHLKSRSLAAENLFDKTPQKDHPDEIRQTIEDFKKIFE